MFSLHVAKSVCLGVGVGEDRKKKKKKVATDGSVVKMGGFCSHSKTLRSLQGLEAAEDLSCDRPLIEYKGKVMLREQYDKENVFFKQ